MQRITLAIHGGAGTIEKKDLTPEKEAAYTKALQSALDAGYDLLERGSTAVEAVTAAVAVLEDCDLFNAGRGSVFTRKGTHEMDAAIMDGATLNAGAVAGVRSVRNPIVLASEIMLHSDHVLLSGDGALEFAVARGISLAPEEYFFSDFRYRQWQEARDSDAYSLDHGSTKEKKFGTVGAVACDKNGNVAAATSTGGMTNKRYGRVGDTPLIGCGTYANNNTCAVSCTGHGEIFIRAVAAFDVNALMAYKGLSLEEAARKVTMQKLVEMNGEGGLIAVDKFGNYDMPFNSAGMYRGVVSSNGKHEVAIYQ